MNSENSRKALIKDVIKRIAYKNGWYQPMIDRNMLLALEEIENWIDSLSSIIQQPYLEKCMLDEIRGVQTININYLGFSYLLMDRSKKDKEKAILRALSAYYLKNRRLKVDYRVFYMHILTEGYIELWIPLNKMARDEIGELVKGRKN